MEMLPGHFLCTGKLIAMICNDGTAWLGPPAPGALERRALRDQFPEAVPVTRLRLNDVLREGRGESPFPPPSRFREFSFASPVWLSRRTAGARVTPT